MLAVLQRLFQAYLMHGDSAVEPWVVGTRAVHARERLDIYRHAYYARLADTLRGDFKALESTMGAESFSVMARAYADAHPSRHPSIRWFGRCLAEFLAGTDPYRATPLLAEIAAFEWALALAFDAPDAAVFSLEEMAALFPESWPAARIQFHPSLQRLDLLFNVPALWRSVVKDGAKAEPHGNTHARPWIVWRRGTTPHYRSLEVDEKIAFDALRQGATFDQACEGLCRAIDEQHIALRFAGLLKGWIRDELVAGIIAHS
ncbi:MAG: putative DNA-binding domain-containing protein [Gammaproteobacteria bacterium]|nr:putative DNA-binding domain-containing protein [Gammaproteobacteria bacterium]